MNDFPMKLCLVIPCYNEEMVLVETANRLAQKISELIRENYISNASKVLFVDDGSSDGTWRLIKQLHEKNKKFSGIKLSRNRGHQNALMAGLISAKDMADVVISMDADLQDDINAIDEFLQRYELGCDIVYGVRNDRSQDSRFKRISAEFFYKFMKKMGADVMFNHADYRLMSKRALESLSEYTEVNLFLRGIVPLIGYKTDIVFYQRNKRFAGETKYPLSKMLAFAIESITSFSVRPVRFISLLGVLIFFISILFLFYFFIQYILGRTVTGWATLAISIWALGGIQLLAIGVIGEYLTKTYLEVKRRPRFFIDEFLND